MWKFGLLENKIYDKDIGKKKHAEKKRKSPTLYGIGPIVHDLVKICLLNIYIV